LAGEGAGTFLRNLLLIGLRGLSRRVPRRISAAFFRKNFLNIFDKSKSAGYFTAINL
jgi:hypothetical protein